MAFIVLGVGDTKMPKTMGPTYKELDIQCQVAHPKGKAILTGLAHPPQTYENAPGQLDRMWALRPG